MNTETKLPELHQTILDAATLDSLFSDLESCTETLAVIPKAGPGYIEPETIDLDTGKRLLTEGALRGLQIRYRYEDAEWWDTLINRDGRIHITRIQQNYD